jgi:peptidoglycan/xylan/chitin deacetylase (PgdA/CDA1 family)
MTKQPQSANAAVESAMRSISRRDFLKLLGGVGGAAFLDPAWHFKVADLKLPVPPTLMLHSKDRWKLVNILAWLKNNGYTSITYRQLADVIRGEARFPEKPIILTMDDIGTHWIVPTYMDMVDLVSKAGYTGVLGLVTLKTPTQTPDIWKTLREVGARGWQLDTHTTHHHSLPRVPTLDGLRVEIVDSAKMIEDGIGITPATLIAPYANVGYSQGKYDYRIFKVAAEAKLDFVVGMAHGRYINGDQAPFYVGRVGIGVDAVQTSHWIKAFNLDLP